MHPLYNRNPSWKVFSWSKYIFSLVPPSASYGVWSIFAFAFFSANLSCQVVLEAIRKGEKTVTWFKNVQGVFKQCKGFFLKKGLVGSVVLFLVLYADVEADASFKNKVSLHTPWAGSSADIEQWCYGVSWCYIWLPTCASLCWEPRPCCEP